MSRYSQFPRAGVKLHVPSRRETSLVISHPCVCFWLSPLDTRERLDLSGSRKPRRWSVSDSAALPSAGAGVLIWPPPSISAHSASVRCNPATQQSALTISTALLSLYYEHCIRWIKGAWSIFLSYLLTEWITKSTFKSRVLCQRYMRSIYNIIVWTFLQLINSTK